MLEYALLIRRLESILLIASLLNESNLKSEISRVGIYNLLLCALEELLDSDWKDDRIIFIGDESPVPKNRINSAIDVLVSDYNGFGDSGYLIDASKMRQIKKHKTPKALKFQCSRGFLNSICPIPTRL